MASAARPLVYPHITKESGVCGGRATEEIEAELADESWVDHAERDKAEYLSRDNRRE